jgi:hypothetical protein
MAIIDRLMRRGGAPPADLKSLRARLGAGVAHWAGRPPDPDLVRARLADGCRGAELDPPTPEEVEAMVARLDDEGWRRLAVLAGALDLDWLRAAMTVLAAARPLGELVEVAFVALARGTPLLTLDLLRQSPLRVEELARKFVARLGVPVGGESAQESRRRLERLDYERLLAEAERARAAAEKQSQRLRQLQDEQEQNRPRRGKW